MEQKTAITLGTFDGVHIGHQQVLKRTREIADAEQLQAVACTFTFPPRLANNDRALLMPYRVKHAILHTYVDKVAEIEFSAICNLDSETFVRTVIIDSFHARCVVVGERFRFGRNRTGDLSTLIKLGDLYGLDIISVPSLCREDEPLQPVSSTWIRSLVYAGKISEANRLLGRPFSLIGQVIRGDRMGREIGYPTANLAIEDSLVRPAAGIFAVRIHWESYAADGLLYIGQRPTLQQKQTRIEVHLPGEDKGDLYGLMMEVHLLKKIRDDVKFSTIELLRSQIGKDVVELHTVMAEKEIRESVSTITSWNDSFPSRKIDK
ncbi:riboflavin biosynthesis protein RibF [Candidatus Acetothermia bacterium]|jgi:riboflavin kinase/FMN adenylyltransferase|nr:riboflavin biosynthesis protein RibF [Candidatus Acetothermia bacterium]MCI2427546.1 riboflavin biosynthesis protein RibF [Candidatus Acetothermia bacterium]MCI2428115.1 riboflavin biosynthesis protein RibF [Candidatus Acetothermia bacterium]